MLQESELPYSELVTGVQLNQMPFANHHTLYSALFYWHIVLHITTLPAWDILSDTNLKSTKW